MSVGVSTAAPFSFAAWAGAREHTLQRLAFLLTGDRAATLRVLHRALAAVHRQWEDSPAGVDPEALVREAIVRALDAERDADRSTRPAADGDDAVPNLPDDDLRAAWDALAALPNEQRVAVVLRYHDLLDRVDLATVLGRDDAAAEAQVSAGLAALCERMDVAGGSPLGVEALLRETCRAYADLAPAERGLGRRVLAEAGRRRRRQLAVGIAAALALLVPLPWLLTPTKDVGSGEVPAWDYSAGVPLADAPEMRWESYGGIEVQVPVDWGHGDLTQWCAPAGSSGRVTGPAVDRPGPGRSVVCSADHGTGDRGTDRPTYAAGLLLRPAGAGPRVGRADVAPGATIFFRRVGGVDLTLVDVSTPLARRILSSATVVPEDDLNGCPASALLPRMGRYLSARPGVDDLGTVDQISVCHYRTRGWPRPTLVGSKRHGAAVAAGLLMALRRAPETDEQAPWDVPARCVETDAAMYRFWSSGTPTDVWVHYMGCGPHGLDDGRRPRALSGELLAPVLDEP